MNDRGQDVTRRSSGNKSCWTFARDNEMYARFQVRGGIQEIRDEGGVLLSDAVCYDSPAVAQFTDNLEYLARNFVTVLLGVRIANSGNLYDGISLFGELLAPSILLFIDEDDQTRGGFHRCDRRLKQMIHFAHELYEYVVSDGLWRNVEMYGL